MADGHRMTTEELVRKTPARSTRVLHLKRPRAFPVLDELVVQMGEQPLGARLHDLALCVGEDGYGLGEQVEDRQLGQMRGHDAARRKGDRPHRLS